MADAMFFSYDGEGGFEVHNTAEDAREAAEECLDFDRDMAADGWSE